MHVMNSKASGTVNSEQSPVVHIVDDDESVRRALGRLVESLNMRAETFASAQEFLSHDFDAEAACLLLDIQLPGMDGFELHKVLTAIGYDAPVIFITAHPDDESRTKAAEADAVAFLEKPFEDRLLLNALESAFDLALSGDRRA
jgi:two-component system response regulator FixJ